MMQGQVRDAGNGKTFIETIQGPLFMLRCACGAPALAALGQIPTCGPCLERAHPRPSVQLGESFHGVTPPHMRIDQLARLRHEQLCHSAPEPHPAPTVACHVAEPAEVPRGAGVIARLAEANGWRALATAATGRRLDRYGRPSTDAQSLALRLSRQERDSDGSAYQRRVVACWMTDAAGKWKFDMALSWSPFRTLRRLSVAELRVELADV